MNFSADQIGCHEGQSAAIGVPVMLDQPRREDLPVLRPVKIGGASVIEELGAVLASGFSIVSAMVFDVVEELGHRPRVRIAHDAERVGITPHSCMASALGFRSLVEQLRALWPEHARPHATVVDCLYDGGSAALRDVHERDLLAGPLACENRCLGGSHPIDVRRPSGLVGESGAHRGAGEGCVMVDRMADTSIGKLGSGVFTKKSQASDTSTFYIYTSF